MTTYLKRTLEPIVLKSCEEFPVTVLTGPRQCGKTTLLKTLFSQIYTYVSLEPPDIRAIASRDPRGFLARYVSPVIFDEIQYVPELLPYLKEIVDAERHRTGQYILTGSQNLQLIQGVTESLAGRAAILRLLPLSFREMTGLPEAKFPWEEETTSMPLDYQALWASFLRGGFPEIALNKNRDFSLWQGSYIQTYLERDVRLLRQVGDLSQFQVFLRALAIRSAQLLSLSDLARDLGVAVNTIKAWISILEATYQIIILRPYFANAGKRLVKMPKIYFSDIGTLCYLTGVRDVQQALAGPMSGAIMETAVVSEVYRRITHSGQEPVLYFWRTASGIEVDLLVDSGKNLIPIEIKSTATLNSNMAKSIEIFLKDMGQIAQQGYVVYTGDLILPLSKNIVSLPFTRL